MAAVLVLIGLGCIIGAIIDGCLKLQALETGKLGNLWRHGLFGGFGVVLTLLGLVLDGKLVMPGGDRVVERASKNETVRETVDSQQSPTSALANQTEAAADGGAKGRADPVVEALRTLSRSATNRGVPNKSGSDGATKTGTALNLAAQYWHSIGNANTVREIEALYGNRVRYYGQMRDRDEVVSEKFAYFIRVPTRSYKMIEYGASCTSDTCTVIGIVAWSGLASESGRTRKGSSRFELTFENGKVVSESTKPL
jgi:hypothetical protein